MQAALKIDVDTYRGIEDGAARLASFLHSQKIPASFFVSLGPDTSGRAATRVFRHKGFLKKMNRTSALSLYGLRTVLSGTVLPPRPMGTSFSHLFHQWRDWGFEVSPHGFNHILWHDEAAGWDEGRATRELEKVMAVYCRIFGEDPQSFAAPGWQAGPGTWRAMEKMKLLYHSDTRGHCPYFPSMPALIRPGRSALGHLPPEGGRSDRLALSLQGEGGADGRHGDRRAEGEGLPTLEIPTTLPTWDEMLAWDGIDRRNIVDETWKCLTPDRLNVWTIHAEFEGTAYFPQFCDFVERAGREGVKWIFLPDVARKLLENPGQVPYHEIEQSARPGRAGTISCQVKNG